MLLDVNNLSLRIKSLVKSFLDSPKTDSDYSSIMEPDFDHDEPNHSSKLLDNDPNMNSYGLPCYHSGTDSTDLHLDLTRGHRNEIQVGLKDACERELDCPVIFPEELLSRVSGDILRMSVAEPCGYKGCAIVVWLLEKGQSRKLTTVFGNAFTPPTFEIHVTLKEDTRGWRTFQKLFLTIKGCLVNNSKWYTSPRIIHPAYQLEKRRLYRS